MTWADLPHTAEAVPAAPDAPDASPDVVAGNVVTMQSPSAATAR